MKKTIITIGLLLGLSVSAHAGASYLGTTDQAVSNVSGTQLLIGTTENITVDAVDLDTRDLSSTTDSVEILQDTHDDLNANANLQVGDADVDNANPVPMSDAGGAISVDDNGGSLTVDGTVGATQSGSWSVDVNTGSISAFQGGSWTIDNAGGGSAVNIQDGGNVLSVDDAGTTLSVDDGAGSLTVDAVDLDIRDLSGASDSVNLNDGTDALDINSDGSLNVQGDFDVSGSTIHVQGPGAAKYERENNIACSPTNIAFAGKVKTIELQALTGSCTFAINGGDSIVLERNTAESFDFEYTLVGDADTVSCSAKDAGATCKATIIGSN